MNDTSPKGLYGPFIVSNIQSINQLLLLNQVFINTGTYPNQLDLPLRNTLATNPI
ncbi:hypothetical protein PLUTE_b0345 [Pseudoalteromonas luteoviolacea DSM 6061]|nr:hypothetical protein [Pseudoalteromonas luteoviolacea DSM 6061]